jgi:hypothetical protein
MKRRIFFGRPKLHLLIIKIITIPKLGILVALFKSLEFGIEDLISYFPHAPTKFWKMPLLFESRYMT